MADSILQAKHIIADIWTTGGLDFCDDDQAPQEFADERGMTAVVRKENGPGGGWPEVEFIGTQAQVEALLSDFHGE